MKNKVKVPMKLTLSVVAACLVSFCELITETAVNIAFPAVMNTFEVSTKTVQWLTTGNLLVVAMITPLSAFLQKRFKLKQLFLFGTYMGYGALVSAAAPALGPTYGGIINQTFGWRYIFVILIPVLIFTLILGSATIEEKHESENVPIDIWGIVFIMLTFLGLVYGFANMVSFRQNPILEIGAFAIGIVALVLFVKHCNQCENPLIDISIFKNIPFTCHLVAFFLINAIMLGTSFLLPNYLQVALFCESMLAGFMLLPGAGLNALMGPFSGAALDKIGAKTPILIGTGLMTLGMILFTVFGMKLSTGMIIAFYIVFGVGCGIAFGNTMTIGNLRLPVQQKAYGNTCFNTLMQFAGAVGTSVCAALVSSAQNQGGTESYAIKTAIGSTHNFFFLLLLAIVCLVLQVVGFQAYKK